MIGGLNSLTRYRKHLAARAPGRDAAGGDGTIGDDKRSVVLRGLENSFKRSGESSASHFAPCNRPSESLRNRLDVSFQQSAMSIPTLKDHPKQN